MPRKNRKESQTGVYHIVVRGNNKEKIYEKTSDKVSYLRILKKGCEEYPVSVYAYCIMTNHVHILLETQFDILPRFMRYINSTYAEQFNVKYDRCGHVFQERYYSDCVETEEYYWCCIRYIHNNPVKVNLVKKPYDYEFGSAKEYLQCTTSILHEKAYKMLKTRFQNKEEFWLFHRLHEGKSFLDTVEDEQIHNEERVKIAVERFMFEHSIEKLNTLLLIGREKSEFFEYCKREMGISNRKLENILKTAYKRTCPPIVSPIVELT